MKQKEKSPKKREASEEVKQKKREILAADKAKSNIELFEKLKTTLKAKYDCEIEDFNCGQKVALPQYSLKIHGAVVGFADLLFERIDEYTFLPVSKYRQGLFTTEHFGIPKKDDLSKLLPMRYVIFLVNGERAYKWSYNSRTHKRLPTLTKSGELCVAISRKDFEVVE